MEPLLELLQHNSAMSREDMAARLGISPEDLNREIARLEAEKVIVGYQAVIDEEKLASDMVTAMIEVRVRPERGGGFDRIARRIARFAEVESCYLMSGGYDLLVVVRGENLRDVSQFVAERLATLDGVLSTATRFHLKSYKQNGILIQQEEEGERLSVTP